MLRRWVYDVVEGGSRGRRLGAAFARASLVIIVVSVAVPLLATDEQLSARYDALFTSVEVLCGLAFTAEYLLRVWVCTEDRRNRYSSPVGGRLRYMLTPMALIDLLAALPLWLAASPAISFEQLWAIQAARVLKLLRYSSALETLGTVIRHERRPLLASATLMLSLVVFLSSLTYVVERDAQPDQFGSVPKAMWWGITTLATVGYGDAIPVTPLGRMIGGLAVVLGMGMFALPAGILASGFAEELRRRNFVVTWNLVASVPFFAKLPAARIAEIAGLLQPRVAVPGEAVVRQGERADSMYFIIAGEVEVRLAPGPTRLGAGDFFGEIALLTDSPRTATVVAATSCQFLVLSAADFRTILTAHADLREVIEQVAQQRLATPAPAQRPPATEGGVERRVPVDGAR